VSVRSVEEDDSFRREVCDWLRANGVDPDHTPMDARPSISDRGLTILQNVQRDGHDVVDPEDPNATLKRTITVPVRVPPVGDVAEWLMPRCPVCGR
jgi:hypothetical protein